MLTGYCLISKGTRCVYMTVNSKILLKELFDRFVFDKHRITCTNMTGGKLSTVLSTRGGTNLKDNFTLVFGLKSVCISVPLYSK